MREYYVDTHVVLIQYISVANLHYGGDLSLRRDKSKQPLMMIGQDESTFHQHIFSAKTWKGSSGFNQLLLKSVGELLMISGYQGREFGLGLGSLLTKNITSQVNRGR